MFIPDSYSDWYRLVASAADLCMKPWIHSVVDKDNNFQEDSKSDKYIDLILRIECRSREGERFPENDIDIEIFCSGSDVNMMLSWCNKTNLPILWQGQNSVWMDGESGEKCQSPCDGIKLESLARRLRSLLVTTDA